MAPGGFNGYVPVRRGVLEHLRDGRMSLSDYLVYGLLLLLADKNSGIATTNAGGIVYFTGDQIPIRTAQDCLQRLERRGYIKRPFRVHGRRTYDKVFIDKFLCTDGALKGMQLSFADTTDWRTPAYSQCAEGAETVRSGCALGAPIQEERIEKRSKPSSKHDGSNWMETALQDLFSYFLEHSGKKPKLYEFTPARRSKGIARLRLCHHLAGEPKEKNAVALFKVAIERFTSSPFHNGQNDQGKKYMDWELLCRSDEKFAYWLDDSNFNREAC